MFIDSTVRVIMSFSILLAGVIGIFRFGQIRDAFRPFIYLIWIGCFTELLSFYMVRHHYYNIIPFTIYSLFESLFLLWFFQKLGTVKVKALFYLLIILFLAVWIIESSVTQRFGSGFTFYFNILYDLIVVLLSIRAINDLLFVEKDLVKNPAFLICIGLLIFFTYDIINRMFRLYGLNNSSAFKSSVTSIQSIINFLSNLIYALAVAWMRKRQPFTFRFGVFEEPRKVKQ